MVDGLSRRVGSGQNHPGQPETMSANKGRPAKRIKIDEPEPETAPEPQGLAKHGWKERCFRAGGYGNKLSWHEGYDGPLLCPEFFPKVWKAAGLSLEQVAWRDGLDRVHMIIDDVAVLEMLISRTKRIKLLCKLRIPGNTAHPLFDEMFELGAVLQHCTGTYWYYPADFSDGGPVDRHVAEVDAVLAARIEVGLAEARLAAKLAKK